MSKGHAAATRLSACGNFRPASNLQFISKLVETVVFKQLQTNNMSSNYHFVLAYNLLTASFTALKLLYSGFYNDILLNLNKQHVTLLLLLYLSAAVFKGNVLSWVSSIRVQSNI